jgi:hypothetical protein
VELKALELAGSGARRRQWSAQAVDLAGSGAGQLKAVESGQLALA